MKKIKQQEKMNGFFLKFYSQGSVQRSSLVGQGTGSWVATGSANDADVIEDIVDADLTLEGIKPGFINTEIVYGQCWDEANGSG